MSLIQQILRSKLAGLDRPIVPRMALAPQPQSLIHHQHPQQSAYIPYALVWSLP
ncbi:predicted protein [Arabidopsis lyrata subsp. lyrata]|uniref:Predicted protein n=1 Tax=Arabidopsis lyrata subsp. lyrata TaxID=81972 RepID=D7LCY7_ARALL|nr:predicted protein [Arabidopsis lyrata subsp. lyrata]